MLENFQRETRGKFERATELLNKVGDQKLDALINEKHKNRPPFDGSNPAKFVS